MKKSVRKLLTAVLAVVFVVSGGMTVWQLIQYRQEAIDHEEAAGLVDLPDFTDVPQITPQPDDSEASSGAVSSESPLPSGSGTNEPPDSSSGSSPSASGGEEPKEEKPKPVYVDPYAEALRNMDFSALQKVNDDVKGWILIPDSKISYPILQGEDNDYYLKHNWKKRRNSSGSIYIEHRCSGDFSDFNTILYGHRMNNKSMFGLLWNYEKQSYYEKHPYVYISDESGSHKYEIFAAYEVPVTKRTYQIAFEDDNQKQLFLDFCTSQSVIETGIVPTIHDKVITMSTCTGDGHETRWVVQAVLKAQLPKEEPPEDVPPTEQPDTPPAVEDPAEQPDVPQEGGDTSASVPAESTQQETPEQPLPDVPAAGEMPSAPEEVPEDTPTEPTA